LQQWQLEFFGLLLQWFALALHSPLLENAYVHDMQAMPNKQNATSERRMVGFMLAEV
jgi:hypothetical protein